ncbi:hypothetical protein LSAT2_008007 [Lamellibrachia satsuma]|nr:hypothetical protein LSAT2_008007 [Lamellibrachia satsuma]
MPDTGTVEEYPTKAKIETSCSCRMAIFIMIGAVIVIGTVIPVILQFHFPKFFGFPEKKINMTGAEN